MQIKNVVQSKNIDPASEERQAIINLINDDKIAEATSLSESLILKYPNSFLLFYSLGMSYSLLAEHKKAVTTLKRAVKLNPKMGDAHVFLGNAYLELEQHDEARQSFDAALALNPNDFNARRGLARATVDLAHIGKSVTELEAELEENPDNANLQAILGQCYFEQEKYKRAIDILTKANEAIPNDNHIMYLLGEANTHFHKPKEAIEWFEKILEVEGRRMPHIVISMSQAAKRGGDFDQAIAWAEEAIELNPEGIAPKNNLARILAMIGDKKKAADLHNKVLDEHAEDLGAIGGLGDINKFSKGDPNIKVLEKLYKHDPETILEEKEKTSIGFILGQAYGDTGQYAKSIRTLTDSNARRRKFLEYDFQREVDRFDLMKHVFEPITPADYADTDKPDDRQMIFILGMPRSGTSLTEQILSTHSQVYGAGELHYMGEETAELMYMFGLQPEVKLVKVAFDSIRAAYLNHIESLGVKERIITDKMPHNFLNLGYVLACFPEAKVIHLNRDPVAVCLSCFQKYFPAHGMGFTFDLQDLGRYYGMYLDMMNYWRQKFPGRIYELDYRDLTENQEEQTRLLLEHCDLPWEDSVLDFHKTRRGVLTASQMQVREKMYKGSSDVWKKYRKYLGPLLDALDEAGVNYS